jgi:integration host factor subunit beta
MAKQDIIDSLTSSYKNLSKSTVKKIVDLVLVEIVKSLAQGKNVRIKGFGSFLTKERKMANMLNPLNSQPLNIDKIKVAYFRPGKKLKNLINENS